MLLREKHSTTDGDFTQSGGGRDEIAAFGGLAEEIRKYHKKHNVCVLLFLDEKKQKSSDCT
jgi:hypothetical protein